MREFWGSSEDRGVLGTAYLIVLPRSKNEVRRSWIPDQVRYDEWGGFGASRIKVVMTSGVGSALRGSRLL
jgi:hypothetical protein